MNRKDLPAESTSAAVQQVQAARNIEQSTSAATIESPQPPTPRSNDDDVTTKIFRFLSTASPQTLGAVGVGLAAVTYFILGKVGLVLIGAFGGISLFVAWEARNPEVSRAVRGETGADALARVLEWKQHIASSAQDATSAEEDDSFAAHGFDDFRPETREALGELVDAIVRDYVKWWYAPILPEDNFFPASCRKVLTSFLLSVSNHLGRKRPADAFLDFLTNSSSMVIVLFSELCAAYADLAPDSKAHAADVIHQYLKTKPESNLANLLSEKQQAAKFKMVANDLLGFLDQATHDCEPARVFLREILAGVVMEMTLKSCSKPEWINGWIVYLLEAGEPDLSQAIDVGMQTGRENNAAFVDIDGNIGNIGLGKGNRNSFDMEKARRKESSAHKKQLSKADEEMEEAIVEMRRMNQMIAEEEQRRIKDSQSAAEAEKRLAGAMERNTEDLDMQPVPREQIVDASHGLPSLDPTVHIAPKEPSSSGDERSRKSETRTPLTPQSSEASPTHEVPPAQPAASHFTSFDQLVPPAHEEADAPEAEAPKAPLTLHNATITIHDEPVSDKGRIKNKPTWDYLIQIEPATATHPGWMIVRKYSDFETLHEVLRRIAAISGAVAFTEQHKTLPSWKVHTRASLRGDLERYVKDACWYKPLAESEGMKRFFERDSGPAPSSNKLGLQAFDEMGKNVLNALTSAPKGMAEGSKVVLGGVTGVFGNMGLGSRKSTSSSLPTTTTPLQDVTTYTNRLSISTPSRAESISSARRSRDSFDSQRSSIVFTQPGKIAPMERRPSYNSLGESESDLAHAGRPDRWDTMSPSARSSQQNSRASSVAPMRSPSSVSLSGIRLPPPPEEMPDDYGSPGELVAKSPDSINAPQLVPLSGTAKKPKQARQFSQLTEQETRVAVELLFAIINELYTLSSAWNIRRTLLAAAKSFLLRPGNPSLTSIQQLIQSSVLEANTSDGGIAAHLRKLRENTLPTEEELAAWPAEMTDEEKEKLRIKARKLLIQSGVPAALMGVMGQSATTDAMGRIFDCLQVEGVARGLIFGMMLQAVRIVTH